MMTPMTPMTPSHAAPIEEHGEATRLAGDIDSTDPAIGLRAVAALRALLERLETLHVDNARERGWSWQEIGRALGVSKQAAHRKHGEGPLRRRRRSDV